MMLAGTDRSGTRPIALPLCLLAFIASTASVPEMILLNERHPTAIRSRGTATYWYAGCVLGGLLATFVMLPSPKVDAIA